ncbi:MAG: cytochrome C551 [Nitrospina sp.]|nr:cytochrome C551 [Nitrospina sp.]|tara:strand:+ start:3287 stop:3487 length:201 start_codon:yes stop_codon:yes gene_type:complete
MAYESSPILIDETEGIKTYFVCGESGKKPYCGGSHSLKGTGITPAEFLVNEARKLAICDCGKSGKL